MSHEKSWGMLGMAAKAWAASRGPSTSASSNARGCAGEIAAARCASAASVMPSAQQRRASVTALDRERREAALLGLLRQSLRRAECGKSTHHPRKRDECCGDETVNHSATVGALGQGDGDRVAHEHAERV